MNRRMYCVSTLERHRRYFDDIDNNTGKTRTFSEIVKEPRKTYCESLDEAKDFVKDIKRGLYPQIIRNHVKVSLNAMEMKL